MNNQIREINIDNIVEFLNSQDYTMEKLNAYRIGYIHNYFNIKDFHDSSYNLISYFFDGYTEIKSEKNISAIGSRVRLNESKKDKILRGFNQLTFLSMYPNIIIKLYEQGEIVFSIEEYATLYKFIVNNKDDIINHFNISKESQYLLRGMINYLYGSSSIQHTKIYVSNIDKVVDYYRTIYKSLYEEIEGIIYIEVDIIYFEDNVTDKVVEYLKILNIPYEIKKDINGYFIQKKKYMKEVDGEIKVYGFRYPRKSFSGKHNNPYEKICESIDILKRELRFKKIKKLKDKFYV